MSYGATKSDWAHFDLVLGLTEDLLPVVSNPNAKISPLSKMVGLGKTPSRYNKDGHAVGLPDWTQQRTTPSQIANWQRVPDYGICVQTRHLRALDIDVPDHAKARDIAAMVEFFTGKKFPMRYRADSGKCLLAFYVEGDLGKRTMKVDGGIVEFLATGQQFIAIGTHPDGARYEWRGGLPTEFPTLTLDEFNEFNELWEKLALVYAIEDPTEGRATIQRNQTKDQRHDDWVSTFLRDSLWYRGSDTDGRVHIFCPWEKGHSGDSGETETVYFPAGSNNIAAGHFKCLHASCAKRTDGDFLAATGAGADGFEVLPPLGPQILEAVSSEPVRQLRVDTVDDDDLMGVDLPGNVILLRENLPLPAATNPGVMPKLLRNEDGGVKNVIENVCAVLRRPDLIGFEIARDDFRDEIVLGSHRGGWQKISDAHVTEIRVRLAGMRFAPVPKEMARDAVIYIASENRFDSAQLWLRGWRWDGVPRVHRFMRDYMGCEDSPYAEAVGAYLWSALAGRVLQPGVKADIVPILVAEGGTGKTSMVEVLAPDISMFMEISLTDKDADLSRRMRGKVVGEIAELRGLHTKEMEGIKAWVTRRYEEFIPKYVEYANNFPRRVVCVGTTDKDEFLADDNNRRWAPIKVTNIDLAAIRRDREQLWAEGAALFEGTWLEQIAHISEEEDSFDRQRAMEKGVQWRALHRLAAGEHGRWVISDSWEESINTWLASEDALTGRIPGNDPYLLMGDILKNALKIEPKAAKRADEFRLGKILRDMGYEKVDKRVEGRMAKVWVKKEAAVSWRGQM